GQPVAKVAQLPRGSRGGDGAPGIVPIVRDLRVPGLAPILDVRIVTACQIFRWWTRKPVNAQRVNGECGNGRLTLRLTRKPGPSTSRENQCAMRRRHPAKLRSRHSEVALSEALSQPHGVR